MFAVGTLFALLFAIVSFIEFRQAAAERGKNGIAWGLIGGGVVLLCWLLASQLFGALAYLAIDSEYIMFIALASFALALFVAWLAARLVRKRFLPSTPDDRSGTSVGT